MARHAPRRREIADRVVGAEEMRVSVDDEEPFHCSDVIVAGSRSPQLSRVAGDRCVPASLRPAWTEGGLKQTRAGSAATYSSLGVPGARRSVHGPRGGPALDTRFVRGAYGGRGLTVCVEKCVARLVAEG